MVRIDKPYTFEGPNGTVDLLDVFEGRPQLVMHHFMWLFDIDADGTEHPRDYGCSSCSSAADGIPQRLRQLHVRNTTLVAVTRAPYDKIARFRERMGWTFPWYSSYGSDFNYDFHATVDAGAAGASTSAPRPAAEAGTWASAGGAGDYPASAPSARRDESSTPTPRSAWTRSSLRHSYLTLPPLAGASGRRAAPPSACTSAVPASASRRIRRASQFGWSLSFVQYGKRRINIQEDPNELEQMVFRPPLRHCLYSTRHRQHIVNFIPWDRRVPPSGWSLLTLLPLNFFSSPQLSLFVLPYVVKRTMGDA
jgi:hypothetical protein